MAQSLNQWIGIGNLGADPEIRTTPNGAKVANFRIACTKTWKDQAGNKNEKTEWVTCVAWKGSADIAEKYLRKGSKLYVQGELQTRQWEDKSGGGKRYATEVLVERIMMMGGRQGGGDGGGSYGGNSGGRGARGGRQEGGELPGMPSDVTPGGNDDDNDLPF